MADKKPAITRANMLHGIVITSSVDAGKIEAINLPPLDSNFVLVSTRDLPGTNRVKVLDNAIPLLTSSQISYAKQPIMALFGFDSESVQLKSKEIEISYQLPSSEGETPTISSKSEQIISEPFTYRYGTLETAINDSQIQMMERTYRFKGTDYNSNNITRITVEMDGDKLHVYAPTQWPSHVRETVSEVTTYPKKKVVIHRLPFYAPHDEMLVSPSILSSLAAVACIKSQCPVEIQCQVESYRPTISIHRKSWYFPDGRVQAEEMKVTVNQGCAPMFTEEMANQLLAGLVPIYPLAALSIAISFTSDNTPPAHFFGDLGYSDSLASTESHYSELAKLTGYSPYAWRMKFASESQFHNQVIRCEKYSKLKDIISDVCQRSDFQRKSAAYAMQAQMKVKLSTFFNYSRGTALACGPGISGFSSECKNLPQQSIQVQLNPNNKVECNTSFYTTGASAEIWKNIIAEELGVEKTNITFSGDDKELIDSGPSVLSANSGRMPLQIQKACMQIKEKRFVQPLPICESVLSSKQSGPKGSLFISNSWVAVTLELEIDAISLLPMVMNVCATISTARAFNEQVLKSKIRHTIVTTLRENGALLSSQKAFNIDIKINTEGDQISSSITSALKGVVTAAYLSALEQALGTNIPQIPVSGTTILNAMRGKE
ncbi:MAG: molybdopterin cofactor-binding domain-containing protein [Sphaerochaeta sp.]|nr:molybdopterin-dependent oxidoreductase [Sphaerochaeta sp.]